MGGKTREDPADPQGTGAGSRRTGYKYREGIYWYVYAEENSSFGEFKVSSLLPHLLPLTYKCSDDPLLDECLVYNIKPGSTTVGNVETATNAQIRLTGSKILTEHCRFENENGVVTLIPNEGASVMVNGLRIDKPRKLRQGYRIILGDFHIFRFNNPEEARAERDKLRQSVLASPEHSRTMSGIPSDVIERIEAENMDNSSSRPSSPTPGSVVGTQIDWSFARREAAPSWLGSDPKIAALSDDELDALLDEMQRVRAARRGRPDSSMDDDMESIMSFPGNREKYASNGTFDDMSLDTAITLPSTPQQNVVEERLQAVKEEMQTQLEKTKEEYQEKLKAAEEANVEIEEIRAEKARMQEKLEQAKENLQKELEKQRQEFESRLEEMTLSPPKSRPTELSDRAKSLAKWVISHWKERRYVRMAEDILQNAATLKEAQIMSNEMEKQVVFQFTIVDSGHGHPSSYDLVLNGISAEDDEYLETAARPCVGIRVMDFANEVVHLWSLEKLQMRVMQMRQIYQYLDRPEYLQVFNHFTLITN